MEVLIKNNTKRNIPKVPFQRIKDQVLGAKYELSLVFVGSTLSKRLNLTYRGKNKSANVLSFPLSKNSGEIFLDLSKNGPFGVAHLYIHGLLHLKGMQHGDTMEKAETKILKQFGF